MTPRLLCGAFVLAAVWAMKRYYAGAGADELGWILGPTAHLAGALTTASFAMEPGEGYLSRERLFLIEKSCAGVNFLIAAFAMVAFTLRRRVTSYVSGAMVLGVSGLTAYGAAVMVNAGRIALALWLGTYRLAFDAAQVHRMEGIAVYFAGLALVYELVLRADRSRA